MNTMAMAYAETGLKAEAGGRLIREYALPDGIASANDIAVDRAGRVWFAEKVGKNIGSFDPAAETFKMFLLPDSWGKVGPARIAIGPQGDIWFSVTRWAESNAGTNLIGRLSVKKGEFKAYRLKIEAEPQELVVDQDGVVWFLAGNTDKLYGYDPAAGKGRGYGLPTKNSLPRKLAVGVDGSIWFTEANVNKIGVFYPDKEAFKEYDINTPFAGPGSLTVAKDGKVWFVEMNKNRIAVLYPEKGRIDETEIPTSQAIPASIVVDDKGIAWFVEYRGNKVGSFNPIEAVFEEFDIPTYNSLPGDLDIDIKRGVIWFSETDTDARHIGMLKIGETGSLAGKPKEGVSPRVKKEGVEKKVSKKEVFLLAAVLLVIISAALVWRYSRRSR